MIKNEVEQLLRRYYEDVIYKPGFSFPFNDLPPEFLYGLKMSSGFIYYKLASGSKQVSEETFKKLRETNRKINKRV